MKRKSIVSFIIAGIMCATNAMAGPFGLDMGMTLKDIGGKSEKVANGKYILESVPKPHSAFAGYFVMVSPKGGLCWIKAIGNNISTSSYGIELKSAFDDMKGKLEKTYGKHKTTDLLMPGSIWKEPNEFMMALAKKERFLMAGWDAKAGSTLTGNIEQIGLLAIPDGREKGFIAVEYYFSNYNVCKTELSAQEDGTL